MVARGRNGRNRKATEEAISEDSLSLTGDEREQDAIMGNVRAFHETINMSVKIGAGLLGELKNNPKRITEWIDRESLPRWPTNKIYSRDDIINAEIQFRNMGILLVDSKYEWLLGRQQEILPGKNINQTDDECPWDAVIKKLKKAGGSAPPILMVYLPALRLFRKLRNAIAHNAGRARSKLDSFYRQKRNDINKALEQLSIHNGSKSQPIMPDFTKASDIKIEYELVILFADIHLKSADALCGYLKSRYLDDKDGKKPVHLAEAES